MTDTLSNAVGAMRPASDSVLDATSLGRARAQVVGVVAVFVPLLLLACEVVSPPDFAMGAHPRVVVATGMSFLGLGAWCLVRGDRLSEAEFFLAVCASSLLSVAFQTRVQLAGSNVTGEWSVLPVTALVATLTRRPWAFVIGTGVTMVSMAALVAHRVGPTLAPIVITGDLFALTIVAVSLRVMRNITVGALDRASRGEVTDALTGLNNRGGANRLVPSLWQQRAREQAHIAVLMADIDHFKRINDARGHAAGDLVIQQVAEVIRATLRPYDLACRVGGEEFLVVVHCSGPQAGAVAERLRHEIETHVDGVTASIGVACTVPEESDEPAVSFWQVVEAADRALYEAKRAGRNRVVCTHWTPAAAA